MFRPIGNKVNSVFNFLFKKNEIRNSFFRKRKLLTALWTYSKCSIAWMNVYMYLDENVLSGFRAFLFAIYIESLMPFCVKDKNLCAKFQHILRWVYDSESTAVYRRFQLSVDKWTCFTIILVHTKWGQFFV